MKCQNPLCSAYAVLFLILKNLHDDHVDIHKEDDSFEPQQSTKVIQDVDNEWSANDYEIDNCTYLFFCFFFK
jgi:hypothetical protein